MNCDRCGFGMGTTSECRYCAARERKRGSRPQPKLTPEERRRIGAGDFKPLSRDAKPDFEVGESIVLSWSRPRSQVHVDRVTKLHTIYEHERKPLLEVTIKTIVRKAKGGWSVGFATTDRHQPKRLVRRKPPARDAEWDKQDRTRPPSPDEIKQASEEGNYTASPEAAVDHLDAVHPDDQNILDMRAKETWAEHERRERAVEVRQRELRQVTATLREVVVMGARMGVDTAPLIESFRSQIAAQRDEIENAA